MRELKVITEGEVSLDVPRLCRELNSRSRSRFSPGEPVEFPKGHYDTFKRQYDAVKILDSSAENSVILTDKDLYAEKLSFIIGMSYQGKIIVNLKRLFTNNNHILSFNRVLNEVLHQLGYSAGLQKCQDPRCLMAPSVSPRKIDDRSMNLCQACTMRMAERDQRL